MTGAIGIPEHEIEGERQTIGADYPATVFALNVMRCDSGGPHWPSRDATEIPARWAPFMPAIERGLASLDGGTLNTDIDGEMWTFCAGEESEMETLQQRSCELRLASLFLNDFFEGWTLFGGAPAAAPVSAEASLRDVLRRLTETASGALGLIDKRYKKEDFTLSESLSLSALGAVVHEADAMLAARIAAPADTVEG